MCIRDRHRGSARWMGGGCQRAALNGPKATCKRAQQRLLERPRHRRDRNWPLERSVRLRPSPNTVQVELQRCSLLACPVPVSYTHLRAHETVLDLVCRLLLEKKKKK